MARENTRRLLVFIHHVKYRSDLVLWTKLLKTLVDMHIWDLMTLVGIFVVLANGQHDLRRFSHRNLNIVQQAYKGIKDDKLTDEVDKSHRTLEALLNMNAITESGSSSTTAGN